MSRPGFDGARTRLGLLLIYFALSLVPARPPTLEILPEPPHAVVQPWGRRDADLDDLLAALAFG